MPGWSPEASAWRPAIKIGSGGRAHHLLKDQRGAAAALVVLMLPVILMSFALALDVSYLFILRSALQSAADLAALAAAQNIDLEALAMGNRRLIRDSAVIDAQRWLRENLQSNKITSGLADKVLADIYVYNARPEQPMLHDVTSRLLKDPTVSVRLSVEAPLFFGRMFFDSVPVTVLADASLLEKADPLPYD